MVLLTQAHLFVLEQSDRGRRQDTVMSYDKAHLREVPTVLSAPRGNGKVPARPTIQVVRLAARE